GREGDRAALLRLVVDGEREVERAPRVGREARHRLFAHEHEGEPRERLDALAARADDQVGRLEVERIAREPAHRVDEHQLPVPEPVMRTAVKPPPGAKARRRRDRIDACRSPYSGSRWQRSPRASAAFTRGETFTGPGFRRIIARYPARAAGGRSWPPARAGCA